MSLDNIVGKRVYFNVRTKKLVAVLSKDTQKATIATVGDVSLGRQRSVRASLFHSEYHASDGQPYGDGYVPVDALPEGHPYAAKAPKTTWSNVNIDDLDALSDEDLAALILEQARIKKDAADLEERAKAVAKARRGGTLGLDIQGDVALVYTSGEKFDGKLAALRLNPVDYQRILLPKPDATMARKILGSEPEKLALCMKDNGPTLTVRKATDEDLANYKASRPKGESDEDFSYAL